LRHPSVRDINTLSSTPITERSHAPMGSSHRGVINGNSDGDASPSNQFPTLSFK
jgi:hypothetical protein